MSDQDVELIQTFQDASAWAKGMCNRISVLRRKITRWEDIAALDNAWNYAERVLHVSEDALVQISTRRAKP